ncbi:MAG: CvpA family protein, partial [Candidatus Brocadiaceae bacterium]
MNWIDYIIFSILFINAAIGLANGPVIQFLRITSLFISFFVTIFFYEVLANILKSTFTLPAAYMLGYFIIFGATFIVTHIVIDIVKRIMDKWEISIGF